MQTNYKKGSRFERQVLAWLKQMGMQGFRMAGSHTPVDVIGIGADKLYLIQCKTAKAEIPDIKQLFKPTAEKVVRAKVNDRISNIIKEVPSNVKLLEEMKVPELLVPDASKMQYGYCRKLILWKGEGRSNLWFFVYSEVTKRWRGEQTKDIFEEED